MNTAEHVDFPLETYVVVSSSQDLLNKNVLRLRQMYYLSLPAEVVAHKKACLNLYTLENINRYTLTRGE